VGRERRERWCGWMVDGCLNVFMIFSDNKGNVNYTYIHLSLSYSAHTRFQHAHPKSSLSKHPTADS